MAVEAESLEVRLSSSGGRTVAKSLDRVKEALNDVATRTGVVDSELSELSGSMAKAIAPTTALASRVDEAADQMGQLARSTVIAGGSLTGFTGLATAASTSTVALAAGAGSAAVAVGALGSALAAVAVTIGGVVAAAGALTAAFGTVVSTGVLAYGKELTAQNKAERQSILRKIRALKRQKQTEEGLTSAQQEQLATLKDRAQELKSQTELYGAFAAELEPAKDALLEVAQAIGQEFIPLIRDTIAVLPQLIRDVGAAIGPLDQFAATLRSLGQEAGAALPAIVGGFFDLAREALPAFQALVEYIQSNGGQAFRFLRSVVERVLPPLTDFSAALLSLVPAILEVGTQVVQTLLPPLTDLINFVVANAPQAFEQFQQVLADVRPVLTDLAGRARELIPQIRELVTFVINNAPQAFEQFRRAVTELGPELENLLAAIQDLIPSLLRFGKFVVTEVVPPLAALAVLAANELIPALTQLIRIVDGAFEAFNALPQPVKSGLGQLIAFAAAAAAAYAAVSALIPIVTSAIGVLTSIAGVVGSVISALGTFISVAGTVVSVLATVVAALNPVTLAIAAVVAAVIGLYAAWETNFLGIRDITNNVVDAVVNFFTGLKNDAVRLFKTTVKRVTQFWTELKTSVVELTTTLQQGVVELWTILKERTLTLIDTLVTAYIDYWRTLFNTVVDLTTTLQQRAVELWTILKDRTLALIETLVTGYIDYWRTLFNTVVDLTTQLRDGVVELWTRLKDRVLALTRTLREGVTSAYNLLKVTVINTFTDLVNTVINEALRLYNKLIGNSIFGDLVSEITSLIDNWGLPGSFKSIMEASLSAVQSVGDQIKGAIQSVIGAVNDAIDAIQDLNNTDIDPPDPPDPPDPDPGNDDGRPDNRPDDDPPDPPDDEIDPPDQPDGPGFIGLHTGGIVNAGAGMPAMLHGREAVMPLRKLPTLMADAMALAGGGATYVDNSTEMTITVEANSRREGREAGRELSKALKSNGIGQ